jgi:hypothetical protein
MYAQSSQGCSAEIEVIVITVAPIGPDGIQILAITDAYMVFTHEIGQAGKISI